MNQNSKLVRIYARLFKERNMLFDCIEEATERIEEINFEQRSLRRVLR